MTVAEQREKIISFWTSRMEMTRVEVGASKEEFEVFTRFYSHALDSMNIDYINKANSGIITVNNAEQVMDKKKDKIIALYNKFSEVEREFPTSIDEYRQERRPRIGGDSCFASCYNTDFEDGTLNGWYGYYAKNNSGSSFRILDITGGYCGPVVKAGGPDPYTNNDYQIRVTSGSATDPLLSRYSTYSMPEVSPWGGSHSVMLGDSTYPLQGVSILSQSFVVTPTTASLTYQYSVLLENPPHSYYEQPFFSVAVLDQNGDTIPVCGQYSIDGDSAQKNHFVGILYPTTPPDTVYWKDWTLVNVPLKKYIGQCVTIVFQVQDCSLGGHFGYAYVDASCSPLGLITSSPSICGQDSISLTAPPGSSSYKWKGPPHGIRGDSTKQVIWVDSAGTYQVVTVPVTGVACADTLSISINKAPGPPPHPSFTANTACSGKAINFTNTSNPITNGTFYWDFYNEGIYNDTNVVSPTWTYASPGTYTVKMHEVYNGCGTDTLITVKVDTTAFGTFSTGAACAGSVVSMTNGSSGATGYLWNFGDPGSGTQDTSTATAGSHLYTTQGTYTVTLIAKSPGPCPSDTVKQTVSVYSIPKPVITTKDSVCPHTRDTLSVTGGTTYTWSNGFTTDSIFITVSATRTLSVSAFNGGCEHDTSITIYTVTPTAAIAASKDSVCSGDTLTLTGSGGTKYKWEPGNMTSATVHVSPTTATTYSLYTYLGSCEDSIQKSIGMIKQVAATISAIPDSICPGNSAVVSVNVSSGVPLSYSWNPGGATTASINVSPTSSTIYTATVSGKCNSINDIAPVTVVPLPKPVITGKSWECRGIKDTLKVNGESNTTYMWDNGKTGTSYITGDIYADSTITLTAYNALNCDTTVNVTVTLRAPPNIRISSPAAACSGNPVQIWATASGIGPFTYSWAPGGQTTDTVTESPDTVTIYTVTVSNGCISTKTTAITPEYPVLSACCNTTIAIGNDTILVASGNSRTYKWEDSAQVTCLNYPLCDSVMVTPKVTTTYTVIGTDALGCQIEKVVTIVVDEPCFDFTVPNVITPNSDGRNDELVIKTRDINGWTMTIYNRWGKEVFKSNDPNEYWKGTTNGGTELPDGVYYYIINATCQQNSYKKDGFIQLIR